VLSTAHDTFLRSLAQAGKGAYYHATFGGQSMESIKADLDKLDKAEFDSQEATQYDEKFQIPLACAVVIALIEIWLGERRRPGRIWKGRFEVDQI
jgi:Ca-activated chloride channel homolog